MNNELMNDEDFIRCSTMIAELLMKYKLKEDKDNEESGMLEGASPFLFFLLFLKLLTLEKLEYIITEIKYKM